MIYEMAPSTRGHFSFSYSTNPAVNQSHHSLTHQMFNDKITPKDYTALVSI
jgi:hypothetical protein